jgi:thiamine pyrophosphokinase
LRGIIFTGGEIPGAAVLRKIAAWADMLAAADSGLIAAEEAGLKVNWVLGDMDSLDDPSRLGKYPPEQVHRFPVDKDLTDTELSLAFLREKSCDEIWIAGGGGGRTDHLFAIRSLFEREEPPHRWYTANEEIRYVREGALLSKSLPPGSPVSVFPLGGGPWEADSYGLKWPLVGLPWDRGSFGISNVAPYGQFDIRAVEGRFMAIMPLAL